MHFQVFINDFAGYIIWFITDVIGILKYFHFISL